mgnify:FL=1
MQKYVWQNNILLGKEGLDKLDPQIIGERLDFLRKQNGGELIPDDILKDAENSESPLALIFTNSVENDAYEYRKQIARTVINSVRIVVTGTKKIVETKYAYYNVRDGKKHSYMSEEIVMSDPDINAKVVREAERKLNEWINRYKQITELSPYVKAIEVLLKERKT